ncbi:MAG: helix-turn-helix domain-containing protein [Pseudomonadota bacterium]
MKLKSFNDMNCSLAKALDVIGERWTLLILRDVFHGIRRFDDLQKDLGIARNILTLRLKRLVDEGILEKRPRDTNHFDYWLTDKGLNLHTVLLSITHWGDRHMGDPRGERIVFIERSTGDPIASMTARSRDGRILSPRDVTARPGPGATLNTGPSGLIEKTEIPAKQGTKS